MSRARGAVRWFGRLLLDSLLLLPAAVRRILARDLLGGLLLLPLGVLALLTVLLATLDEVRVLLIYPVTDDVTPGTWGGPTMAGAWAVHAGLGLLFFPVYLAVLAGIRALADRVASESGRYAVLAADAVAVAFLIAFARQL